MQRSEHRVTVWAGGVNGTPVSCACGWKAYAKTRKQGYKMKHEHEAAAEAASVARELYGHGEPWYR